LLAQKSMTTATLAAAAPFIIQQDYAAYTDEQHDIWADLVGRVLPQIERHATPEYLEGFQIIGLRPDRLPNLAAITARLGPRTGWSSTPVSGFLPGPAFFEMLACRLFPTTTWLRTRDSIEYTPEPDIFHDVFGHVPMHSHRTFANFLQRYGQVCAGVSDSKVLEKLGRLFWFTVEFGLIRQENEIKVYGSGIISSHRECRHVLDGGCEIRAFSLDEVLNTPVKVDELQRVLFAAESFEQIYQAMHEAERRALAGHL